MCDRDRACVCGGVDIVRVLATFERRQNRQRKRHSTAGINSRAHQASGNQHAGNRAEIDLMGPASRD